MNHIHLWFRVVLEKMKMRQQGICTYMVIYERLYKISNSRECVSKTVFDRKSVHERICEYIRKEITLKEGTLKTSFSSNSPFSSNYIS